MELSDAVCVQRRLCATVAGLKHVLAQLITAAATASIVHETGAAGINSKQPKQLMLVGFAYLYFTDREQALLR